MNNSYALLIGVNDYAAFDASLGQPAGTSDLRGAVNDALAWARMALDLQIPPERVRVCATPQPYGAELARLGPSSNRVDVRAATGEEVRDGIAWLLDRLATDPSAGGLLFIGGHGVFVDSRRGRAELVFVPSDGTGVVEHDGQVSVVGGLHLQSIKRGAMGQGAAANLTIVIDTCHTPCAPGHLVAPMTLLRAAISRNPASWPRLGDRLFTATTPRGVSAEAVFADRWHGAFTWAMVTAMSQWRSVAQDGVVRLTVSHGRLLKAASGLLKALRFDQRPQLTGVAQLPRVAMFRNGLRVVRGETSREPDRRDHGRQIDAGHMDFRIYQLDKGNASQPSDTPTLGLIIVTGDKGSPSGNYRADTEYWRVDTEALGVMDDGYTMWIADCTWETAQDNATVHRVVTWEPSNVTKWTVNRIAAYDKQVKQKPPGSGTYRRVDGTLGTCVRFQWGSNPPGVTWYNDGGYCFETDEGAPLGDGPYVQAFTAVNKATFQAGSADNMKGWHEYGCQPVRHDSGDHEP